MLTPGTNLGPYIVIEQIGAGGMGEVYRARDSRLKRNVALKLLPKGFAEDSQRMARFEREAQLLAALNHPNIASIYGVEESNGIRALVMELVEGPSLAEVTGRGPLSIDETLPIARQIAEAIEYAHERGIVHRDLKPANVKLTPDGAVKVLDFGLAKAVADGSAAADPSTSPTSSHLASREGLILGTAAYMSPEQAKGKTVDRRTDVWAFGCVLFEVLAGRKAFEGETVSETLAAVLRGEPDWAGLPKTTPAEIRTLLERCLRKDIRARLQSIGDARIALEEYPDKRDAGGSVPSDSTASRPRLKLIASWTIPGLILGMLITWMWTSLHAPHTEPAAVERLMIDGVSSNLSSPAALSPDGRLIAFAKGESTTRTSGIYVRRMDSFESRLLPGTESGRSPFFSPDGTWIAYAGDRGLMKVPVGGGAPQLICPASSDAEGAWGPDGTIVLAYGVWEGKTWKGLLRVSSAGGEPRVVTTPDPDRSERVHSLPSFLPDGHTVLFTVRTDNDYRIDAISLRTGEGSTILQSASAARYSPTGHLLYQAQPAPDLAAVSFDPDHLKVRGAPVVLLSGVESGTFEGRMTYDLAGNGTLIYTLGAATYQSRRVVWVDRRGVVTPLLKETGTWAQPRISPDGQHLLLREIKTDCDLWSYDLKRQVLTRLTFDSDNHDPVWMPDGGHVSYVIPAGSPLGVVEKPVDGSGPPTLLFPNSRDFRPMSWSADGRLLALMKHERNADEVWVFAKDDREGPKPFIQGRFNAANPQFSPDGRYLAYSSDESGRVEIYLRPYPGPGGIMQISNEGGDCPVWSRDGRELLYMSQERLMAVTVRTRPVLSVSAPAVLFRGTFSDDIGSEYDIASDGKRFVMIRPPESVPSPQVFVILNYFSELKHLIPAEP